MSTKLVRKFLRNTSDLKKPDDKPVKLSKKKRKLQEEEQGTPATEQDVIDMHIKCLLAVDNSIATRSKQSNKRPKKERIGTNFGIGNSRGSAAQASAVQEPTFDKKRHAKEKKQKSLQKIAAQLMRMSAKKKKA
jgi:hypothetical protein